MHPIPAWADAAAGTARRRTIHRATKTSTMGVSISSAVLVPRRGNEPQRADSTENEACRKYEMVCMTFAARPVT